MLAKRASLSQYTALSGEATYFEIRDYTKAMSIEAWSALGAVLSGAAGCVAIVVAIIGLSTWRRQLKGTAEYDLTRRLMFTVYKLRDALEGVRDPFLSVAEGRDGPADAPWEVVAYDKRWSKVREALIELDVVSLECEVIWGNAVRELKTEIIGNVRTLSAAVTAYARIKLDKRSRRELTDLQEVTLYRVDEADDKYSESLRKSVSDYENFVKPHLKRE